MKATFFIVMLWLHNDQFHTTVVHVPACPPKNLVENNYENLLKQKEFKAWGALCATVDFSLPNPKKENPKSNEKELKV
tara:strand:- start:226 stop:459 length:234 start_codon:yes stop_codon:yes gene_type:complete